MKAGPKKLTLNQETLRNLTPEETARAVGGFNTGAPRTCPECPAPFDTYTCP